MWNHAGTDVVWTCGCASWARWSAAARSAKWRGALRSARRAALKLMQRVRATGSVALATLAAIAGPLLEPNEADLRGLVAATPDIT